jgi:uncharacterized protein YcbX
MSTPNEVVGKVVSLWRFPVKSMMGEELNAAEITAAGILGDRAYGVLDVATGKIASAKNPKKWPDLFQFRAAYVEPPQPGQPLPAVRITLPDGAAVLSSDPQVNRALSAALGREVALQVGTPNAPSLEEYWPAVEGLTHQDAVTDEAMRVGTFFDSALVHVLSTGTLNRLRALYPEGRFEVRRFRPNVVVETSGEDFVENAWISGVLNLGDQARLSVTGPCPRCVMTTLAQGDLPPDLGILRAAAKHNGAHVGVYASVHAAGRVMRGDSVALQAATSTAA